MSEWMKRGCTAVVTGGANGIGLAAAKRYVEAGMNLVIVDRNDDALAAAKDLLAGGDRVLAVNADVADFKTMQSLQVQVAESFGDVHCLMNNAGVAIHAGAPWESMEPLQQTLSVNMQGVIHGCHAFIPAMLEHGQRGVVINTGSKQGITRPPGNYAYNLSKAGVLAYTESVAHAFATTEGCQLSAHLLVPGFVYSNMIAQFLPEKPDSAWTTEETVDHMLPRVECGDFYIICPDNETPWSVDQKRIAWNVGDITENRPALSRWHPDYKDHFDAYMSE